MLHYVRTWIDTLEPEQGQDLAEYALLAALIAVALMLVVGAVAGSVGNLFNWTRLCLRGVGNNVVVP